MMTGHGHYWEGKEMHFNTREVLGEIAYLQRTAELLVNHIGSTAHLVSGSEVLDSIQAARLGDAFYNALRAQEHIELATQYVSDWQEAINTAVVRGV